MLESLFSIISLSMSFSDSSFSYTVIIIQLRFRKVIFTILMKGQTAASLPSSIWEPGHEFQSLSGFSVSVCDANDVFLLTDNKLCFDGLCRMESLLISFFPVQCNSSVTLTVQKRGEQRECNYCYTDEDENFRNVFLSSTV